MPACDLLRPREDIGNRKVPFCPPVKEASLSPLIGYRATPRVRCRCCGGGGGGGSRLRTTTSRTPAPSDAASDLRTSILAGKGRRRSLARKIFRLPPLEDAIPHVSLLSSAFPWRGPSVLLARFFPIIFLRFLLPLVLSLSLFPSSALSCLLIYPSSSLPLRLISFGFFSSHTLHPPPSFSVPFYVFDPLHPLSSSLALSPFLSISFSQIAESRRRGVRTW